MIRHYLPWISGVLPWISGVRPWINFVLPSDIIVLLRVKFEVPWLFVLPWQLWATVQCSLVVTVVLIWLIISILFFFPCFANFFTDCFCLTPGYHKNSFSRKRIVLEATTRAGSPELCNVCHVWTVTQWAGEESETNYRLHWLRLFLAHVVFRIYCGKILWYATSMKTNWQILDWDERNIVICHQCRSRSNCK